MGLFEEGNGALACDDTQGVGVGEGEEVRVGCLFLRTELEDGVVWYEVSIATNPARSRAAILRSLLLSDMVLVLAHARRGAV